MSLRDYVTDRRFQHLQQRKGTARKIQLGSALLTSLAFASPFLVGKSPSDFLAASVGWAMFFAFLTLTIASLLLDTENPSVLRVHSTFLTSIFSFLTGAISLVVVYWGPVNALLIASFLLGPGLALAAGIFRAIPSMDVSIQKQRGAPPGQYGNLQGIAAELGVTRKQRFAGMTVLGVIVALTLLIGIGPPQSATGPWHELGESVRFGNPNWTLFLLFTLVPALIGISVGAVSALAKRKRWEPLVLDTFENHRLWFYHGIDSHGFFEMKNPNVERLDERTVKITHHKVRWMSIKIRTNTESDAGRLLTVLSESGD